MTGVIINVITVIVGYCIGLLFKKGIPEKVSNAYSACGPWICTTGFITISEP